MKYLKVIFVALVIIGMVLSYALYGLRSSRRVQAPVTTPTQEETSTDSVVPTEPIE